MSNVPRRRPRCHLPTIFVPCVAALILDLPGTAGEVRLGDHTFAIPEGFELELACEPGLVDRPISAAFDDEGRLYVTDSSGFSGRGPEQLEKKPHRVVRLVDTDEDGRFDRRTVYADRMMFPEGAMWFDGSLYVAAPPSIWKLTDTDDDGVADAREEWFLGQTLTGCANDLHGPYLGLDGWIYWAKGAFAQQTYERPGGAPFETRAAHLFRWRADRRGIIEPVMTGGMDNPIDVVFTPGGERIFTTTFLQHPGGGQRDGLIHAIYGGVYGKVHNVLDDHKKTGDIMPVMAHLGPAVPCGLTTYRSGAFGEGYRDNLFATLFNLHKVARFALTPRGATFDAAESDFMVSDNPDFHPTDAIEDGDGSLIVLDTGGWYKVCCPSSQLAKPDVLGAIYRIRRASAPRVADPRGRRLEWEAVGAPLLAGRLNDPRPAVRDRAIARLAKLGEAAVPALERVIEEAPGAEARRNAVWTLTRIDGAKARAAARLALADPDASVRQAAAHSAAVRRDRGALPGLLAALATGPDAVRRSAAEALGRLGDPAAVPALLAAASRHVDRALEHSLIYALIEIDAAGETRRGLASRSRSTRKAALIALDQMDSGELAVAEALPLLTAEDSLLRRTGVWVLGHHAEWAGDLVPFLESRLALEEMEAPGDLAKVLALFAADAAVQELLARTVLDGSRSLGARETCLDAMAGAGLKVAPAAWIAALGALLERGEPELRARAIGAARRLRIPADEAARLTAALLGIARDASTGTSLRVEALAALPDAMQLEPGLFEFLVASLDASGPVVLRTTAAGALAKSQLDQDQTRALIHAVRTVGPLEVNRLLGAFEKLRHEDLSLALIGALEESPGRSGLQADTFKEWLKKGTPLVRQKGEELLESLREGAAEKRSHLLELAASLKDGDVRRGQSVFNGEKAGCASCHSIGYLGGNSGPDLTRIGQVRTEHDLLESIVYPSITFVRSYEPMLVVTQAGEVLSGYLVNDAPDEVVLMTGPAKESRIPRDQILEMKLGTTSIMPAGLTDQLSRQELADLIAFLRATRW